MSTPSAALDAQAQLVAASRERGCSQLSSRERLTHGTTAVAFGIAATTLACTAPSATGATWLLASLFVMAVAVASRIELEVGSGFATPVELVVVPMLFALPAGWVPAAVALGLVFGHLPAYLRGSAPSQRMVVALGNASYTVGPAIVFALWYEPAASPQHVAAVAAAALGAQFVGDAAISTAREYFAVGVDPRSLIEPFEWIFFVDVSLASVGLAAGLAGTHWTPAYFLPLPLLLMTRLFARERTQRLTNALELSAAYRGTALLLGDVVTVDDAYTGAHSRDVVELTLAVCDRLGVDARERHLAELTALLHDVGKITIPKAIINKPGPLTPAERAIVETHTIEGERLLSQVGGLLTEVGQIVRACHERYDGLGYPDGLAGEEIPLIARIICACDAFNAMTTTRPYRTALPLAEARAELARHRGTQFDPAVVDAALSLTV